MKYPDAWGLEFEEIMGLTWLAYKGKGDVGFWNIGGKVWTVSRVFEYGSFRAITVHGRKTVLSFSGTDNARDWIDNIGQGVAGISPQYARAVRLAKSSSADIVVGHSLGGGLASYCALYCGKRAATVNPSPLNINPVSLVQMIRNKNLVVNYIAPGEILHVMDAFAPTMGTVGAIHNVRSNGGFNPAKRHRITSLDGFVEPVRVNIRDHYYIA
jgi:hypothetical protein